MLIESTLPSGKPVLQDPSSRTFIHQASSTQRPNFRTIGLCRSKCLHKSLALPQWLSILRIETIHNIILFVTITEMISQWILQASHMAEMNDAEKFFMSEIELALVALIQCINENYDPTFSRQDLEIMWVLLEWNLQSHIYKI